MSEIKLILGDCLIEMKKMADKSVDLILTAPPYGIGCDKGVGGGIRTGRRYADNWDVRPKKEYFDEMIRISKQAIIFGGNFFTDLLTVNGHWIVWDKTGQIKFDNPYSGAELAWTNIPKNTVKKYVIIQAGFIAQEKIRYHPTQKPVALFSAILRDYTEENDLICDPFFGSGTCALACKEMKRNFIGIEIKEEYFKMAENRLKQAQEMML